MNKWLYTLLAALTCSSSVAVASIEIDVIDPGLIIDPGIFIGPIRSLDPCNGATYRFTVDGGTITKYDEVSETGVYRATATATLTSSTPDLVNGYIRQSEVATLTGGEFSWNSSDILVLPGQAWVTGRSFARHTLAPQTGDNSYTGYTDKIFLESSNELMDESFRYIFDNYGGNIEFCLFQLVD